MATEKRHKIQIERLRSDRLWYTGVVGWLAQKWTVIWFLISTVGASVGKAGLNFYWAEANARGWGIILNDRLIISCWVLALVGTLALLVWRKVVIDSLECKIHLHDLIHVMRDDAFLVTGGRRSSHAKESQFAIFAQRVAQKIAEFFVKWAKSQEIGCVIWIGRVDPQGKKTYVVLGVSNVNSNSKWSVGDEVPAEDSVVDLLRSMARRKKSATYDLDWSDFVVI